MRLFGIKIKKLPFLFFIVILLITSCENFYDLNHSELSSINKKNPPVTTPAVPPVTPPVIAPDDPPVTPPDEPPVTPPDNPPVTPPDDPPVTPPDDPVLPPVTPPDDPPVTPPDDPPVTPPVTPPDDPPASSYGGFVPVNPGTRMFNAINMSTEANYTLSAELVYEGEKCHIWVESAYKKNLSADTAKSIAYEYDRTIFPRMMDAFNLGENIKNNGIVVAKDPMEYASWMVNGDNKLNILLMDILDGYKGSGGYVAGYFYSNDLMSYSYSNRCNMIYVDTNPGLNYMTNLYDTLAHEMQHMMNFAISKYKNRGEVDTWIDEGLSVTAEYIRTGQQITSRLNRYKNDPDKGIENGNNFYVWDNPGTNVLDDYATAYMFFQWLRVQAGGINIFREILYAADNNYNAVTKAAFDYGIINKNNDWPNLLKDWLAANYINSASGLYGYKNEALLKDIQAKVNSKTGNASTGYSLLPGEGIYTRNLSMPVSNDSIKYAGLPSRGSVNIPDDISCSSSDIMLSYNTDTNVYGSPKNCYPFSNVVIPLLPGNLTLSLNTQSPQPMLPDTYPVSMNDLFRERRQAGSR
ncbi:MAG: hypothetical protein FWD78_05850 [Treponema sp.]|nr:hypothetical protein [Treponema sp.]